MQVSHTAALWISHQQESYCVHCLYSYPVILFLNDRCEYGNFHVKMLPWLIKAVFKLLPFEGRLRYLHIFFFQTIGTYMTIVMSELHDVIMIDDYKTLNHYRCNTQNMSERNFIFHSESMYFLQWHNLINSMSHVYQSW